MNRRSVLSMLGAVGLGGCTGVGTVRDREWPYKFAVADGATDDVSGVGVDLHFTHPYSTVDSPAVLKASVSNDTESRVQILLGGPGLVSPRQDRRSRVYLYPPSSEVEHAGDGVWTPRNPDSVPDFYTAMLVSKSIPAGGRLARTYRVGLPPTEDTTEYPTGRIGFDCEERSFVSLSRSLDLDFVVESTKRD